VATGAAAAPADAGAEAECTDAEAPEGADAPEMEEHRRALKILLAGGAALDILLYAVPSWQAHQTPMFTPEASASPPIYILLPALSALLAVRRVLACAAVPVEAEAGARTLTLVLGAVLAKVLSEGAPCAYALSSFPLSRRPLARAALGVALTSAAARGTLSGAFRAQGWGCKARWQARVQ